MWSSANIFLYLICTIIGSNYVTVRAQNQGGGNYNYNPNQNRNLPPAPRSLEFRDGVLRVNGIVVPRCFYYNNGRYIVNSQVPLIINGMRIPDWFVAPPELQSRVGPPQCPRRNTNQNVQQFVSNNPNVQQFGSNNPNVQTIRQTIQHRRGVLRINGLEVPRCFWYDRGRFFVDRQTPYEIIINGRQIPSYYVNMDSQRSQPPPRCPGRYNGSPNLFKGHLAHVTNVVIGTVVIFYLLLK